MMTDYLILHMKDNCERIFKMSETSLIPIKTKEHIERALEFFHTLKEIRFTNEVEYENGILLCKSVKGHINIIDKDRKELVKPLNDNITEINGECNVVIKKLQHAEAVIKKGMAEYFQTKERQRIEEQKRLEAETEERRRKELERARREQEKADAYREQGREEMAQRAEARAETAASISKTVVAPIIQNMAKVAGTSFKVIYKIEVINKVDAIKACLSDEILVQYINIDIKGIERLANSPTQKGKLSINGISVTEDTQVSMRIR